MKTVALIMAGGSGTRVGSDTAKQSLLINGKKIFRITVERFCKFDFIDGLVLVGRKQDVDEYREDLKDLDKVIDIVEGGTTRSESVFNGLCRLKDENAEIVAVHDAVRPFVEESVVKMTVEEAFKHGGAVAASECTDTIAEVVNGELCEVLDRSRLRNLQTPQTFRFDVLLKAHELVKKEKLGVTDDTGAVMLVHSTIKVVKSSSRNIKITTLDDLVKAQRAGENG